MRKIALFVFLLLPITLLAQTRTQIKLEGADHATGNPKLGVNYLRNPRFSHDGAILTCDSAVLYNQKNVFEAYGNVHINQGDTLNIYSDFLNYDGNAKKAHLETNVRLVDRDNTLTTNILDYDMVAKIGEYKDNGKLVNKDATITSKTGFYFSNTRDAYFKIDVLVVTAEKTNITSDNLRYNTGTNWTYFYGPTNIRNTDDHLYTENGAYNTKSENAYFGKNNLYTNNTRSLKGDSLYYYGKQGYGKAVKNITFRDTKDQTLIRGQLGEYYKAEERVRVTIKAYVGLGTDDSVMVNNKKIPDTLWLGADTLETERALVKTMTILEKPILKKNNEIGTESDAEKANKEKEKAEARKLLNQATEQPKNNTVLSANPKKLSRKERKKLEKEKAVQITTGKTPPLPIDSLNQLKLLSKKDSLIADSLLNLKKIMVTTPTDSTKTSLVPTITKNQEKNKPATDKAKKGITDNTTEKAATLQKPIKDSIISPLDTARARMIKAYHNVRVYKSNMQAKADSLFYTAADSVLRWFKNPIIWSDGNQQTGDSIQVYFKNKKIYAFRVIHNGFLVNIDGDSTKFNQVKGKLMTGFFHNGELRNMYVDGNAESIYYSKNDKGEYDNVNQTVSSRLNFKFKDKELTHLITVREVEGAVDPIDKLEKEAILTGFIWKPELRPRNKKDITLEHTPDTKKKTVKKGTVGDKKTAPITKTPVKKGATNKILEEVKAQ